MSLHPHNPDPVPTETARIACAAFPKGNAYIHMRKRLDSLYRDEQFDKLFPSRGKPPPASGYPGLPGGWHSSQYLSSPRTCRIGRLLMPSVLVLTGSTLSPYSSTILGSTTRSSVSSVAA